MPKRKMAARMVRDGPTHLRSDEIGARQWRSSSLSQEFGAGPAPAFEGSR